MIKTKDIKCEKFIGCKIYGAVAIHESDEPAVGAELKNQNKIKSMMEDIQMATTGDRVGAIIAANAEPDKEVTFAGYGVYKGDEIPPKGIGIMGMDLNEMGRSNPRIDLDDGTTIWGCQCWWGPECQVEKMMENYKNEGYQITQADPDEYAPILTGATE